MNLSESEVRAFQTRLSAGENIPLDELKDFILKTLEREPQKPRSRIIITPKGEGSEEDVF